MDSQPSVWEEVVETPLLVSTTGEMYELLLSFSCGFTLLHKCYHSVTGQCEMLTNLLTSKMTNFLHHNSHCTSKGTLKLLFLRGHFDE